VSSWRTLVLSPAARPLRFAGTGGIAGAIQVVLLALLIAHGWDALAANAVAFLLAAQVNFVLSRLFTWHDRQPSGSLGAAWLLFHGSIALTALLNMLTFAAARSIMPSLAASAAGIAVGALGNYFAGDWIVFRRQAAARFHQRSSASSEFPSKCRCLAEVVTVSPHPQEPHCSQSGEQILPRRGRVYFDNVVERPLLVISREVDPLVEVRAAAVGVPHRLGQAVHAGRRCDRDRLIRRERDLRRRRARIGKIRGQRDWE
jgi:putative flippase GtrA